MPTFSILLKSGDVITASFTKEELQRWDKSRNILLSIEYLIPKLTRFDLQELEFAVKREWRSRLAAKKEVIRVVRRRDTAKFDYKRIQKGRKRIIIRRRKKEGGESSDK